MKRILFVDDESRVLQGLRRMLRSLRHDWDMEFAESGPEALNRLADLPFDVVVTDMRMPGMDGAQLLREVMNNFPSTVRIILSGQCDREAVLKCVSLAHQFLTKPCDSEILKSTVARACRLRDAMVDQGCKRAMSHLTSVPSHPVAHTRLVTELESREPSMQAITEIICREIGMTAKTLQLISSSFFGTPQRVSSPAQAIQLLGLDTIKPLILTTEAFVPFDGDTAEGSQFKQLTKESRKLAAVARAVAEFETTDDLLIGDAFLAGFLRNLGPLASAHLLTKENQQLCYSESADRRVDETYANSGAYLLALWGLPDPIVTAIAMHRKPSRSSDRAFTPLTALHVATVLVEETADNFQMGVEAWDIDYLKQIGCVDRVDQWRQVYLATVPEGALS